MCEGGSSCQLSCKVADQTIHLYTFKCFHSPLLYLHGASCASCDLPSAPPSHTSVLLYFIAWCCTARHRLLVFLQIQHIAVKDGSSVDAVRLTVLSCALLYHPALLVWCLCSCRLSTSLRRTASCGG